MTDDVYKQKYLKYKYKYINLKYQLDTLQGVQIATTRQGVQSNPYRGGAIATKQRGGTSCYETVKMPHAITNINDMISIFKYVIKGKTLLGNYFCVLFPSGNEKFDLIVYYILFRFIQFDPNIDMNQILINTINEQQFIQMLYDAFVILIQENRIDMHIFSSASITKKEIPYRTTPDGKKMTDPITILGYEKPILQPQTTVLGQLVGKQSGGKYNFDEISQYIKQFLKIVEENKDLLKGKIYTIKGFTNKMKEITHTIMDEQIIQMITV